MPDWSYRTVLRPVLFQVPAEASRTFSLGFLRALSLTPGGGRVIDFLGHMRPDRRLQREAFDRTFIGPVGLASAVDPSGMALGAFARFGFGFIEVGPVTLQPEAKQRIVARGRDGFVCSDGVGLDLEQLPARLDEWARSGLPVIVRLKLRTDAGPAAVIQEVRQVVERIDGRAAAFVLPIGRLADENGGAEEGIASQVLALAEAVRKVSPQTAVLVAIRPDQDLDHVIRLLRSPTSATIAGVVIDGCVEHREGLAYGADVLDRAVAAVRRLRQELGPRLAVVAGGGVHHPGDALALQEAGANLVLIDSGLVFSGPGLPKRINEAVLGRQLSAEAENVADEPLPSTQQTWFWTLLMGVAMLLGGFLAMVIALTRVVLPYDESIVELTRDEIARVNDRLLPFMQHDRVTLAGTMLAVGTLYTALSLSAVRSGQHWARVAIIASGFAGFASFFLFLGFGYFDPLHAFVTAILFQFLLLSLHSGSVDPRPAGDVTLYEDQAWRMGQWGQLLFVVHGFILIVAGIVISIVGITTVFVPEDLWFMETCPEAIAAASPRLIPLIAHDRATFGGMLIACGVVVFLSALWGWHRYNRALWWSLLIGGLAAYVATIWVHMAIGYDHPGHLLPAYGALALLLIGCGLSYGYLAKPNRLQT